MVEDETELQLRVLDAVDLHESRESEGTTEGSVPTMFRLAERRNHHLTQWPHRSWIMACLLGNGREGGHFRTKGERQIPQLWGVDHSFSTWRSSPAPLVWRICCCRNFGCARQAICRVPRENGVLASQLVGTERALC